MIRKHREILRSAAIRALKSLRALGLLEPVSASVRNAPRRLPQAHAAVVRHRLTSPHPGARI